MMKLKRVLETAEQEGRKVEEVALERYATLGDFEEALAERRFLDGKGEGTSATKERGKAAGDRGSVRSTPTLQSVARRSYLLASGGGKVGRTVKAMRRRVVLLLPAPQGRAVDKASEGRASQRRRQQQLNPLVRHETLDSRHLLPNRPHRPQPFPASLRLYLNALQPLHPRHLRMRQALL